MIKEDNPSEVKADRSCILIKPNEYVKFKQDTYQITQVIDFNTVIGVNVKTNKADALSIHALSPVLSEDMQNNDYIHRDLSKISDDKWKEMEYRLNCIRPLIEGKTRQEIIVHSEKIGIHYTTLYRWLKKYQTIGSIMGLLPNRRGSKKGTTRIPQEQESIIQDVINNSYLSKQKITPKEVIKLVKIESKKRGVLPVGDSTIRDRISKITAYDKIAKREGRSKARNKFNPVVGEFPNADYPLSVVQIDHTPVDLIIVDDETREPIGRPWLTLAIDIYSRMVTGYYLSLDAPSTTSVAMCIANSILSKDRLLLMNNVEAEWSVWGVMDTIHVDNGADFRSSTLTQSCLAYNINLEFRPVGKSHFGGHIERLLGTFSKEIHTLSGTTFSNIQERGDYDSDKNSSLSFSEFETWLVTYITKVYHKKIHSSIQCTPEQRWYEGILGSNEHTGVGFQPKPSNSETVLIDFLPIWNRTIQRNGININGLRYFDNVLRPWINAVDSTTSNKKKFIIRQDPRDISYVWFYEPSLKTYYKIPLSNQSIPSMNYSEYKRVREHLKQKGLASFNENILIEAYEELKKLSDQSVKLSKKIRRQKQNKKNHKRGKQLHQSDPKFTRLNTIKSDLDDLWNDDIKPFDNEGEY